MDFLLVVDKSSTDDMNELAHDFKKEEINVALKQMHPTKVSGLDDKSPFFYQKYWHLVGSLSLKLYC